MVRVHLPTLATHWPLLVRVGSMASLNRSVLRGWSIGAVALAIHLTALPVRAQSPSVPAIGEFTVGSPLKQLMRLRRENCQIEPDQSQADCTFINGDGIQYVVLGQTVESVIVDADRVKRRIRLPFALVLGESLTESLKKLTASEQDRWTIFRAVDGGGDIAMVSTREYSSSTGARFRVQLLFKSEKLVEIRYGVGTV